jgi:SnoaL-like domain
MLPMRFSDGHAHPFRAAAERGDTDALLATLAPDVVLHSPVTFQPYAGKETVGGVLRLVSEAFDYWRCVEEVHGSDGATGLVFHARVGDRELEGLDLLRVDANGLIIDLTVMIRPLSGLTALAQAIGRKVDAAGLKPSKPGP